jgi:hypothetical protein
MKSGWISSIYRPEGSERSLAIRPVNKPVNEPQDIGNLTLAELIALATKKAGMLSK